MAMRPIQAAPGGGDGGSRRVFRKTKLEGSICPHREPRRACFDVLKLSCVCFEAPRLLAGVAPQHEGVVRLVVPGMKSVSIIPFHHRIGGMDGEWRDLDVEPGKER